MQKEHCFIKYTFCDDAEANMANLHRPRIPINHRVMGCGGVSNANSEKSREETPVLNRGSAAVVVWYTYYLGLYAMAIGGQSREDVYKVSSGSANGYRL